MRGRRDLVDERPIPVTPTWRARILRAGIRSGRTEAAAVRFLWACWSGLHGEEAQRFLAARAGR